uniref:Uncharacterized protein n=1 Tax=Rhodosorus marinus TaxID=101924 RepID=A0A7S2ZI96_9RHOD|mmetsp:Transcript_20523/g.83294  ORF Transcript_20523/g.83294 Transcript_20523/m.83294 type:complete len:533 (+) Transcript_20523:239-1837(+)
MAEVEDQATREEDQEGTGKVPRRNGGFEAIFNPPEDQDEVFFDDEQLREEAVPNLGEHVELTWRGVIAHLGPAFLISVGYLDPGNWATDIEGGSRFGYELLWVLIMSNLMAILLQTLATRLGVVTRSHLAEVCKEEYTGMPSYALWILAELAIIATDLTEVLGTAIGLNLVFNIPLVLGVILTALDTFLLLAVQRHGMRRLEQLMFGFLAIISACFIAELFFAKPDILEVVKGTFIPRLNLESLYVACGIVGATVMPHNFYLHSAIVGDRMTSRSKEAIRAECKYNLIDSAVALNAAVFINCAILIISAANFWAKDIEVATLQDAYRLLENTGFTIGKVEVAQLLFGIALIASGQSSTLCGTLAGQYVMEGFLEIRAPPVIRRLVTRMLAVVPSVIVILATGDSGTYQLLILSQVVLSLQLPFAVIPLIRFTSSKVRMGEFQNHWAISALSWICAVIVIFLNLLLVLSFLKDGFTSEKLVLKILTGVLATPLFVVVMLFLLYITFKKERSEDSLYVVDDLSSEDNSMDNFAS